MAKFPLLCLILISFSLACSQLGTAPGPDPQTKDTPTPDPSPAPSLSGEKELLSLAFLAEDNPGILEEDFVARVDDSAEAGSQWLVDGLAWNAEVSGLVARFEISPKASLLLDGEVQVSGSTANDYASPLVFSLVAEDGSTRPITLRALRLEAPSLAFGGAGISPSVLGRNSAGLTIILNATVEGRGGGDASRVAADLSALGLSPALPLEKNADGSWSLSAALATSPGPGHYAIPVVAEDEAQGLAAQASCGLDIVNPAFAGGDMEEGGPLGLPAGGSLAEDLPFEGRASFHYAATAASSSLVGLSSAKFEVPQGASRLVFYFKGSTAGTAPGLRVQLGAGASNRCYYDLNAMESGQALRVEASTGGSYSTKAIEAAQWTRVELELANLRTSADPADSLGNYTFQFRVRAGGIHDWGLDFIHFE